MTSTTDTNSIPGMIEPVEQILLKRLAATIPLEPDDCIIEFGTFLGRSTACLAEGLSVNPHAGSENRLYAYDSFECAKKGAFAPHLLGFCEKYGVTGLLRVERQKFDFQPVFEHYLQHQIDSGLLVPVKAELENSLPPPGPINLMHIDSPKFYQEFRVILFRFIPRVRPGGILVFQDFFYHWSASLIAVCGLLIERGFLRVVESAASSLVCESTRTVSLDDLLEIEIEMQRKNSIPRLIDVAKEAAELKELDRREVFLPRLTLAKIQWLFENGDFNQATNTFVRFFNQGGKLNDDLVNDYLELMRSGFAIRKLYEQDHG
jgi:hypothetical protein